MIPAQYLDAARHRLRLVLLTRGVALVVGGLLAATAALAWLIVAVVPAGSTVTWLRVSLYLVLLGCLAVLGWWPYTRERAARALEARIPAFDGRLVTWLDGCLRGDSSGLFDLLERETGSIAERHPVAQAIPARQFLWPMAAAAAAICLLALLLSGDHPWQLAAQRLWAGELFADAAPRVLVRPGNAVVRRGSDVVIDAEARGFLPDDMSVHASFGGSAWEEAPMSKLGESGYGFVFVGVGEEIEYYVSARGITSARHRIRVADLPRVTEVALTYRFPSWTGLDDAQTARGDVTALPDTVVDVVATTDRPLREALLIVNGERIPMDGDGRHLRGTFRVAAAGSWHVATPHQGDLARLSDSYLITVAEDGAPEVTFSFPGADRKATPIEEVALEFSARDDYGVESLALSYSVNGSQWRAVPLPIDKGSHVLALESLTASNGGTRRPLEPGDVISLYAEARDHVQSSRTALYFVDVRPYDMRYRESQRMAGQGQSEGGGLEIAERQRDILSATWNLLNKRDRENPQAVDDQANVLAMLQRRLRDQVETLLSRSRARGLGDTEVSPFLRSLSSALEYMEPAAARLQALDLDDAVAAEQRALSYLVAAESSARDVDVSLTRDQGRGTSGRSLSELIELEMDPERNRYEVPQQPRFGEAGGDDLQNDWRRLEKLAARQERLGRRQAQGPASLPSRWEQARLRRQIAELRRELASRRARDGGPSDATNGALANLDEAERSLDRQGGDAQAGQRAAQSLRRAATALRESSRSAVEERLDRAGRQAANLNADQSRVMEALASIQRSAAEQARRGEDTSRGDYAMQTFGAVKRRMQSDLGELRQDIATISEVLDRRGDGGGRYLERALRELDQARVDERLSASAEAFEMGQPLYVIGSEAQVEQALARLARRVDQARDAVTHGAGEGSAEPLEQIRTLRRRLAGARTSDGMLAAAEVESVARAAAMLQPGGNDGDTTRASRMGRNDGVYEVRGIASENTATLYRMTLERLDLMEAALERADSTPVRAQTPRDPGRDSAAAARYFRELSTEFSKETTNDD